jgi:hypothetical protein
VANNDNCGGGGGPENIIFIRLDEDALHAAPTRTMKLEPGSLSAACIGGRGEIRGT